MRDRSNLWKNIVANGHFDLDVKAVIAGKEYTSISAPVIEQALFDDAPSVGHCASASMRMSIQATEEIPKGAAIKLYCRVADDAQVSEWLQYGTYFIDKRSHDNVMNITALECCDAMRKMAQRYVDPTKPDDRIGWPKSMLTCVAEVAHRIGVAIDERTVIRTEAAYQVAYPTDYTMQQVMEFIAACHGGNWIITQENKLRLVPLDAENSEGISATYEDEMVVPVVIGSILTGQSSTISRVTLARDEKLGYTQGDDTGIELRISGNPYASDAICTDLYAALNGLTFYPYELQGACFDPCGELGDKVTVGTQIQSTVCKLSATLDVSFRANISMPGTEETGSEYPYLTEIEKLQLRDEQLQIYMDEFKEETNSQILQTTEKIDLEVSARKKLEDGVNQLNSKLEITKDNITASVEATKSEILDETQKQIDDTKAAIIQLNSDNLEIRFSQVKSLIDQLEGDAAKKQRILEEYIRFEGARMELGRSDSVITAVLANDRLSFFENGQEVAYISNLTLYVTEIHVLSRFVMGDADNGPFAHTFGEGGTYDFAYEGEV